MSTGEPAATESGHGWFGWGPSEKGQVNWHLVGGLPYITSGSGRRPLEKDRPPGRHLASGLPERRIVITRMGSHPPTRAYAARRGKEGLSKPEIIRCLKRYAARETYRYLRPD
jgi:transposase